MHLSHGENTEETAENEGMNNNQIRMVSVKI